MTTNKQIRDTRAKAIKVALKYDFNYQEAQDFSQYCLMQIFCENKKMKSWLFFLADFLRQEYGRYDNLKGSKYSSIKSLATRWYTGLEHARHIGVETTPPHLFPIFSPFERSIIKYRLEGYSGREICRFLQIAEIDLNGVQKRIREKYILNADVQKNLEMNDCQ